MAGQFRYKVFFTPILSIDDNTYSDEIDVSDRVEIGGIGAIKKSLDSADYDVGLFFFSDITLKGHNKDGYFNESDDVRSIFKSSRDLCKVRIVFSEYVFERDGLLITSETENSTITFKGLLNEEATKLDVDSEAITFKVLSLDSVLRTTKIASSIITNGSMASDAIYKILNTPRITSVLNLDVADINPDFDFAIDDGSKFDNKSVKEKLNLLLIATNSILYINDSNDIIVRNRYEDTTTSIHNLYGHSDILGRENVIGISDYNSGLHRAFTSFKINNTEYVDQDFAGVYGFRQKKIELDFVTDVETELDIATNLVEAFKSPRIELKVKVSTTLSQNMKLLERVSLNYPLRIRPIEGKKLPVVGINQIGDAEFPLPYTFGSVAIHPNFGFKILEIAETPRDFTSVLKLRQIDNYVINAPGNSILGYAILGDGTIGGEGGVCSPFVIANIGGARLGCTVLD